MQFIGIMTNSPAEIDVSRLPKLNLIWAGLAAAAIYWLAESLLHAFYWNTGTLSINLLAQSGEGELEMRLIILGMMLGFGFVGEAVKRRYRGLLLKQLQHNRLMRFLSDCNQRVQRKTGTDELFQAACKGAVEIGEFRFAWIGMLEEGHCKLTAWAADPSLAGRISGLLSPSALIHCLSCQHLIQDGVSVACDLRERVDCTAPWRDELIRLNTVQALAMPLKVDGKTVGVFEVFAGSWGALDKMERVILDEVADDISHALQNIRQEAERERLMQDMKRQLDELLHFQKLTVGRELRMKELAEENAVLRNQLAPDQPDSNRP